MMKTIISFSPIQKFHVHIQNNNTQIDTDGITKRLSFSHTSTVFSVSAYLPSYLADSLKAAQVSESVCSSYPTHESSAVPASRTSVDL